MSYEFAFDPDELLSILAKHNLSLSEFLSILERYHLNLDELLSMLKKNNLGIDEFLSNLENNHLDAIDEAPKNNSRSKRDLNGVTCSYNDHALPSFDLTPTNYNNRQEDQLNLDYQQIHNNSTELLRDVEQIAPYEKLVSTASQFITFANAIGEGKKMQNRKVEELSEQSLQTARFLEKTINDIKPNWSAIIFPFKKTQEAEKRKREVQLYLKYQSRQMEKVGFKDRRLTKWLDHLVNDLEKIDDTKHFDDLLDQLEKAQYQFENLSKNVSKYDVSRDYGKAYNNIYSGGILFSVGKLILPALTPILVPMIPAPLLGCVALMSIKAGTNRLLKGSGNLIGISM